MGFEIASSDVEYCDFNSEQSLLDWDIILFRPNIYEFLEHSDTYKGKPSLSDSKSFRLKERCDHWRREIKDNFDAGKCVVIFLSELKEFYIDTGEKKYSGTGRNRQTTRIVTEYDNYKSIPVDLSPTNRKGRSIKLAPKNSDLIAPYWSEFGAASEYKVVLNEELPASLLTKHGDKTVGAVVKSSSSAGALIMLPDVDFYAQDFYEEVELEDGTEEQWTDKAVQFAGRLIKCVSSINSALRNDADLTPEPDWATANEYSLDKEAKLMTSLSSVEEKLAKLQTKKNTLLTDLKGAGKLRALLYETGKPLEAAILDSLGILGFKATNYEDDKSEFDAVFESKEGRLVGEAEGKDNKAINVTKLRQLALNVHEDLERDEIVSPAKGVLFGNPYRFSPIKDRTDPFTEKCKIAAQTSSTALVFTPDLFDVARYLSNHKDASYAKECREIIASSIGRVVFPEIPEKGQGQDHTSDMVVA